MQMVNHKRIAKNTLLLYLRMALIMLIGLVASRVVLSSLGAVDFGLYNVIGGIVVALSFMSGAMNASCNRYYSMALGKEDQPLLHEVFKANLLIYALFCLAVLIICETLGLWLLNAKLVIPVERMGAARWVYQFSIVTFVSGLLTALKRREKDLRAFKCGPDYIDPMFHASALGVPCRNLDLQFFDENTLRFSLAKNGGSLSVIEGVMGYYDGVGMTTRASSYAVAMASDTPAVLVVDARGAAHSVLAVIGGFLNLHPKSHIRGVILNRCSAMLYPRMKQAIADQFGGAVLPLGYLPVMKDCTLESRHLGLITAQEMTDLQEKLGLLADQIEKSVDIPGILALAAEAPPLSWEEPALPSPVQKVRVAVARDRAFCFYYQDNLDLLQELGAELVPFSPIADAALPENIRGLYLGGGYPELYAESLSENQSMKDSIRQALEAGLPCIAECGGFLYLQKALEGRPMVGFLPGTGHNTGKLSRFGYVTLTAQKDNLLCAAGEQLPAHEFHYYDTTCNGEDFLAQKADGRAWRCGIATENLYAGFPHFHFYAHPQMAARFLEMCRKGSLERPERI